MEINGIVDVTRDEFERLRPLLITDKGGVIPDNDNNGHLEIKGIDGKVSLLLWVVE